MELKGRVFVVAGFSFWFDLFFRVLWDCLAGFVVDGDIIAVVEGVRDVGGVCVLLSFVNEERG